MTGVLVFRGIMKYRNLGRSGLKVSELSFGSWLTFGNTLNAAGVKSCLKRAFELGVNFFDNAETYAKGEAEVLMGEAFRAYRREDLVITTKIFWGGNGPNDIGLSRKHIIEGTQASLSRLKLKYVDVLFCHRPDPSTPLEETVRAMDYLVNAGFCFYWGTSEWPAEQLSKAYEIASALNLIPPTAEQPQYNLLHRRRVEEEYAPLIQKYGLGLTTWSPLASGILSGKYNAGIPKGSRLEQNDWLKQNLTPDVIEKVKRLSQLAQQLDCSVSQLAIAWCLSNPNVSTVITGASSLHQIEENMLALKIRDRLTPELKLELEKVFA